MGNHGLQVFIVVLLAPLLACPVDAEPITPEVGLNEQLKALYKDNPGEALAAYKECKKHGDACHMPCTEISNCAGCHPEDSSSTSSGASVCGFCMPGHVRAEDKKSCTACEIGSTSKGGRATSCSKCPPGQTTLQEGSHTCTTQQQKPATNRPPAGKQVTCPALDEATVAALFETPGAANCPSEGCTRTLVTEACKVESVPYTLCRLVCNSRSAGDSQVYCGEDGTWVAYRTRRIKRCTDVFWTSSGCVDNGFNSVRCDYSTGQCKCPGGFGVASYLPLYGCVADRTLNGYNPFVNFEDPFSPDFDKTVTQRCALRVTENPARIEPCASAVAYPGSSTTKCTQVSIMTAPTPSNCKQGCNTTEEGAACWVQVYPRERALENEVRAHLPGLPIPGWVQAGADCFDDPYSFLAPCPSAQCRQPPSSEACKVTAGGGLNLYTAPCANAPVVQKSGRVVVIKQGDTFRYLDRNSRQSSDCGGYGYNEVDDGFWFSSKGVPDFCWVMASYEGMTGWVQTQKATDGFTSALCTQPPPSPFYEEVAMLVSDDGSATGCAEQTVDLRGEEDNCFPADATVMLRDREHVRMSDLALGDEVAVHQPDGSLSWEPVYAFAHRDSSKMAEFVELEVVTSLDNGAELVKAIQATAGHFVLVGESRPEYKRAGDVAQGDTMWVVASHDNTRLVPAVVSNTKTVRMAGLYAPLTLSGSIVVNDIAASVHSTWFADSLWSALGLPDAWLHSFYQAVLAPVRFLWHVWPQYPAYYTYLDETYGLSAAVPNLAEFVVIITHAAGGMVAACSYITHALTLLFASGILFVSCKTGGGQKLATKGASSRAGAPSRLAKRAAPLLLLVGLCLVCCAHGSRMEDAGEDAGQPTPAQLNSQRSYYDEPYKHSRTRDFDHSSYEDEYEPSSRDDYYNHGKHAYGHHDEHKHYGYDKHHHGGHSSGCTAPPNAKLPGGSWSCPSGKKVPVGGTCTGVCKGPGWAEITCTENGWSKSITGACFDRKVCAGLPTAPLVNGNWPEGCRNTAVDDLCISKCNEDSSGACQRSGLAVSRCTKDGWSNARSPIYQLPAQPCAVDCSIPADDTLPNGFWPSYCREKGVALGERCYGACYGSLAVEFPNNLDQGPYALCTEDGMEIFNADKCLPL